jgi:hypothetical protein
MRFMGALIDLARDAPADSSVAFRQRIYRRGDQGELIRDVVALANAPVVGRRFLFLGIDDEARPRKFPGVTARSWRSFCEALPEFLARTVEPPLTVRFETLQVGEALIGAVCLDACEDPPYLLARRINAHLPAGGGWIRRKAGIRRLQRRDFERIFARRLRQPDAGQVRLGFPGEPPREELELAVLPLDELPSQREAEKFQRILKARQVSRAVLGRSDSRIARLVHTQVVGSAMPYQERGTGTMQVLLDKVPVEEAEADDYYRHEVRAHRVNIQLQNLSDQVQSDLLLTLKIPRVEGFEVARRLYAEPGSRIRPKQEHYPRLDVGPRTISIEAGPIRIPRRSSVEAFLEPLRLLLREDVEDDILRVGYVLRGPTLGQAIQGRLKIYVIR